jgi:hypothetical protein
MAKGYKLQGRHGTELSNRKAVGKKATKSSSCCLL